LLPLRKYVLGPWSKNSGCKVATTLDGLDRLREHQLLEMLEYLLCVCAFKSGQNWSKFSATDSGTCSIAGRKSTKNSSFLFHQVTEIFNFRKLVLANIRQPKYRDSLDHICSLCSGQPAAPSRTDLWCRGLLRPELAHSDEEEPSNITKVNALRNVNRYELIVQFVFVLIRTRDSPNAPLLYQHTTAVDLY
jgi:hypothetical protein